MKLEEIFLVNSNKNHFPSLILLAKRLNNLPSRSIENSTKLLSYENTEYIAEINVYIKL